MDKREQSINIPQEHICRVMNSLLCENFMGFERRLNEHGKHEWRGKMSGSDEWTDWNTELEEIIDFAGDLREVQDLLQFVCHESGVGYNLVYDPRNDMHIVFILEIGPEGKPIQRIQIQGKAVSTMMCAALCGLRNLDIPTHHKELYPGHYLQLNS